MGWDPEYNPPAQAVEMRVPEHSELFDVILLRDGVELWDAKLEHIKRVMVRATSTLEARSAPALAAEAAGHSIVEIIGRNATSETETAARRRAIAESERVQPVDPVTR